ncbi:MAG: type II toxin-antitoxin system RelE/ParE family toxin [Blastocatellia bacterium]
MSGYQIDFTKKAKVEAEDAYCWIAQYSREKAVLWYFDLEQALESLSRFPARCPIAPESRTFKREIRHLILGKYRTIFEIRDETVHILRIRHSSMQTAMPESSDSDATDENHGDD